VTTVGLQLIASRHSLVDQYMAFDVGSDTKLYQYTGDEHYFEVACSLRHNTKVMLAPADRPYDLAGSGWQQEHWSVPPPRRWPAPRLASLGICSHIEGLVVIEDFDRVLYADVANPA
jgi:hypothetical protein